MHAYYNLFNVLIKLFSDAYTYTEELEISSRFPTSAVGMRVWYSVNNACMYTPCVDRY